MDPHQIIWDIMNPNDSSSSDELEDEISEALSLATQHLSQGGSSQPRRRRKYLDREREQGHIKLVKDYFSNVPPPLYTDEQFRRRFRMRRPLFLRIVNQLSSTYEYFCYTTDATGRQSLSPLQKCTAAMRMLAYGMCADQVDEYLRMGESTARQCLANFVDGIISLYGTTYLRRPTPSDMQRLLYAGEMRGFPGMIGSIDCMHWEWKNCPTAWHGQFSRGHGKPTIILEAVASYDLWIWHAFFGSPGTLNDINVLDRSPVFDDVLEGRSPPVNFTINDHEYNMSYYLTDGIYPQWASFVPSIRLPRGNEAKCFAHYQEAYRKDVERAFGVLQARFAIVKNPIFAWDLDSIGKIMKACIILHNMIVEDERDTYKLYYDVSRFEESSATDYTYSTNRHTSMADYINNRVQLRSRNTHQQLKEDLVKHIWQKFGHVYLRNHV